MSRRGSPAVCLKCVRVPVIDVWPQTSGAQRAGGWWWVWGEGGAGREGVGVSGVFLVSASERIAPAYITCARHGFCQAPAVVVSMGMDGDGVARFHFSR